MNTNSKEDGESLLYNEDFKNLLYLKNKQKELTELINPNYIDYIFPHMLLPIKNSDFAKIKQLNKINTKVNGWNSNFYNFYRYTFLNILNKKHESRRDNFIYSKLYELERIYFGLTSLSYAAGGFLIYLSLFNKYKILYFYLASMFIFTGKYYSLWYIHSDIENIASIIKKKYNKEFNLHYLDVLDETMIDDWKCYLYWYNLY